MFSSSECDPLDCDTPSLADERSTCQKRGIHVQGQSEQGAIASSSHFNHQD